MPARKKTTTATYEKALETTTGVPTNRRKQHTLLKNHAQHNRMCEIFTDGMYRITACDLETDEIRKYLTMFENCIREIGNTDYIYYGRHKTTYLVETYEKGWVKLYTREGKGRPAAQPAA